MSTTPSRLVALAAVVAVLATWPAAAPAGERGAAVLQRFTPAEGGFSLNPAAPAVVDPAGKYLFALAANRLLCTIDAETGSYVDGLDLGADASFELERQRIAPLSIAEDGSVLALVAVGKIRFYDVGREGRLTVRSEYPAPTGTPAFVGLSPDGTLAVFASGPSPAAVSTVRTRDAHLVDSIPLSSDETPISSEYAAARGAISIVTPFGVLIFRHNASGRLSQTGAYARLGFAGDAYSGIQALGKRGRVIFTIEAGGTALIGISLKGDQTARAPARLGNRFSSPIKVSADGKTIAVATVNGQTGGPAGISLYKGDARGIVKGDPDVVDIDPALGPVSQLAFDATGTMLAVTHASTGTVVLVDVPGHQVLATSQFAGSSEGLAFLPSGDAIAVTGSAGTAPLTAGGASGIAILPLRARGFDEANAVRFARLPGVIFGAGDGAYLFPSRFFGVATSDAADALFSFNTSSGRELQRIDLGRSTGLLAVAPDNRTLIVSAEGGLAVYRTDDAGALHAVGEATPGADTDGRPPSVAFHPTQPLAFVTAGRDIWTVNLDTGEAQGVAIGDDGARLTNPVVGLNGTRLYAIENGERLIRCAIDPAGRVTYVNRTALQLRLDPVAPRVAYDAGGAHMWACGDGVLRQFSLLSGTEEYSVELGSDGRDTVLVAGDLVAVIGDPVEFFAVGASEPVAVSEATLGAAPHGAAGVDAIGRRIFVGAGDRVVAVDASGSVVDLAGGDYTLRVVFSSPPAQVVYPDVARFPGSVVAGRGF